MKNNRQPAPITNQPKTKAQLLFEQSDIDHALSKLGQKQKGKSVELPNFIPLNYKP